MFHDNTNKKQVTFIAKQHYFEMNDPLVIHTASPFKPDTKTRQGFLCPYDARLPLIKMYGIDTD